jgi:hypothetical protein
MKVNKRTLKNVVRLNDRSLIGSLLDLPTIEWARNEIDARTKHWTVVTLADFSGGQGYPIHIYAKHLNKGTAKRQWRKMWRYFRPQRQAIRFWQIEWPFDFKPQVNDVRDPWIRRRILEQEVLREEIKERRVD